MKNALRKIAKPLLILLPFVVGLIGFLQAEQTLPQAIYNSICLYGMGHKELPANFTIEIARWLAPLATAGSVVLVISVLRKGAHNLLARMHGDSVGVYGKGEDAKKLLETLGAKGIDLTDGLEKADRYVLMGEEEENFFFYTTYLKQTGAEVYLRCQRVPAMMSADAKLHLFSAEETAARLFWKDHSPLALSQGRGHKMDIVLLGFGKLGRELLLAGLQNNIFHPAQEISYHVFGKEDGFGSIYAQLDALGDKVIFHEESWFKAQELLKSAAMVIVAEQEGQLELLQNLRLVLPEKAVHVFSRQQEGAELLAEGTAFIPFDWKEESLSPAYIFREELNRRAKKINLRYAHLYEGVEETEENMEVCWKQLDSFTRYSNLRAADYHDVRLAMKEADLERLAELEHIRWCRYHYLNNWRFGVPENGKNKDPQQRIHKLLIPYGNLPEEEKEKDRENVRLLFSLDEA